MQYYLKIFTDCEILRRCGEREVEDWWHLLGLNFIPQVMDQLIIVLKSQDYGRNDDVTPCTVVNKWFDCKALRKAYSGMYAQAAVCTAVIAFALEYVFRSSNRSSNHVTEHFHWLGEVVM